MYDIDDYKTEAGKSPFQSYMQDLANDNKQSDINKIIYFLELLGKYGPEINKVLKNAVKAIDSKRGIYELRPKNNRILYFYLKGKRIVLLHGFKKKSRTTPDKEIKKAIREQKDYILRHEK